MSVPAEDKPPVRVERPRQQCKGPMPASSQPAPLYLQRQRNARRLEWFTSEDLAAELLRRVLDEQDPTPTENATSITCPDCGRTSWHAEDVARGYCGACHATTGGQVTRPCIRCAGCGLVADTDEAEPWTAWTSLAPASALAVRLGLVHPALCPSCLGRKRVPA